MQPELVIFDCDGVLVDSEPISVAVLMDTVAKAGIRLSPETVYDRFLGKSMTSICETLSEEFGVNLSEVHLADLRRELFARFRQELRPVVGVLDALKRLKLERCVASSSQPDRIRLSLEITGLFDAAGPDLFSASMVERGKPAPDLFVYAAQQMGVDPSRCIVIEDSPPGIIAAQEAGMKVFAFQGASHSASPALRTAIAKLKPDQIFARMEDLPVLLASVSAKRRNARGIGQLICAVDVGSSSARAGLFDVRGQMLSRAALPIETNRHGADNAEHDSEQIWQAVVDAVRTVVNEAEAAPESIVALGFDATCSLVFRGREGEPVAVSNDGQSRWDTIAWHDHRAGAEADECTALGKDVLEHVGTAVSPEMQIPKLMWMQRHAATSWQASYNIFDLADFLTWKATNSKQRSVGILASKWMYMAHKADPWPRQFFTKIGLTDLMQRAGLPEAAVQVGNAIGRLAPRAVVELGLPESCVVGTGLIDAHAGILGLSDISALTGGPVVRELALVAGTSNCIGVLGREQARFDGIWGPYFESTIAGYWLSEAGQSATGALLDHMIRTHGAGGEPDDAMHRCIVARVRELRSGVGGDLAPRLHVLPDFNGNRSPLADPHLRGVVSGIGLDATFDGLCKLYWRTCVGIALGMRHLVEHVRAAGDHYQAVNMAGGHVRNPLLLELYRDTIGLPVNTLIDSDAVLLGTAMNAAVAAGLYGSTLDAVKAMQQPRQAHNRDVKSADRIARDYRIFCEMIAQRDVLNRLQNA